MSGAYDGGGAALRQRGAAIGVETNPAVAPAPPAPLPATDASPATAPPKDIAPAAGESSKPTESAPVPAPAPAPAPAPVIELHDPDVSPATTDPKPKPKAEVNKPAEEVNADSKPSGSESDH
jgi:hypothetical protein